MSMQHIPLGKIIPYHDYRRSHYLGKHIPDTYDINEEPHDHLIDAKTNNRCQCKESHLFLTLLFCMKYYIDTENIVDHQ